MSLFLPKICRVICSVVMGGIMLVCVGKDSKYFKTAKKTGGINMKHAKKSQNIGISFAVYTLISNFAAALRQG